MAFFLVPLVAAAAGGLAWITKDVWFDDDQAVQAGTLPQGANGIYSPLSLLGVPPAAQLLLWGVVALILYRFARKRLKL